MSFHQVTAILRDMPRPRTERQALEEERDVELPAQLAQYRRDLEAVPPTDKRRREFVEWQISVCGETDGGRLREVGRAQ